MQLWWYPKSSFIWKGVVVSPLATWFRPGEIGLMGRSCTHESLGEKQGKPEDLVVQTPGAKCGDRRQVKRTLRIGVTKRFGHVCPRKLNRPPLPSGDRRRMWDIRVDGMSADMIPDVRYPGGWNVNGQDSGCDISRWMECRRTGFRMWDIRVDGMSADRISDVRYPGGCGMSVGWNCGCEIFGGSGMSAGWNERFHKLRTLKNYNNLCICLTPRKPVLHSLYQVPTFLGMLMVSIFENTKVKKGKKRRYKSTQED